MLKPFEIPIMHGPVGERGTCTRWLRLVAAVAMLVLLSNAALAQAQGNPLDASDPANPLDEPATAPFAGEFTDGELTLTLRQTAEGYRGSITFRGAVYPVAAEAARGVLTGVFDSEGKAFPFTVTTHQDALVFATGSATYTLRPKVALGLDFDVGALLHQIEWGQLGFYFDITDLKLERRMIDLGRLGGGAFESDVVSFIVEAKREVLTYQPFTVYFYDDEGIEVGIFSLVHFEPMHLQWSPGTRSRAHFMLDTSQLPRISQIVVR